MNLGIDQNQSWNDIWKDQLKEVLYNGRLVKKDDERNFVELIGRQFTLGNPRDRLIPDGTRSINIFQCIGQFLWIAQGNSNVKNIEYYQPGATRFSSDGFKMIGAYGPRLFGIQHLDQIQHLLGILYKDSTKRKAVASIYLPQFDQHGKKKEEVPCTLNLQYLIRDNKVNAITFMRSQDVYTILPYDLFIFTMLQEYVTAYLQTSEEVKLGTYHHFSGSFHVYKRNEEGIRKVIESKSENKGLMEPMPPESVKLRLIDISNFEIALRNAVNVCIKRNVTLDFDFYDDTLEDSFKEEYWRQIGRILLCYGALKMKDYNNFERFKKKLNSTYQYYINLYVSKHHKTDSHTI